MFFKMIPIEPLIRTPTIPLQSFCIPNLKFLHVLNLKPSTRSSKSPYFWVAVKEFKLSYYIGETLLFTIYTHCGNLQPSILRDSLFPKHPQSNMSYSLNSSIRGHIGEFVGDYCRGC